MKHFKMLEIEDRGMEIDKTFNMAVLQKASEILQSLGRNDIALEIRDVLEKDESDTKNSYQNPVQSMGDHNHFWYMKTFIMLVLTPIRICGLFLMDVLSDIFQIISLYRNCHNSFCGGSIGLLISSYFATATYIKYIENLKWTMALSYPSVFMKGLVRHVGKSWMAMSKGKDLPDLPKEDDKFIKRVTFFEVVTESLPQLTFSNMIIRLYGVSDNPVTKFFQLFSLASSMFSLVISFITRQTFLRPMVTPAFESTLRGFGQWLMWKTIHLLYVLCSALPMSVYIATLLVLSIERSSTIELPIIMTMMLHPMVALPFGVVMKTFYVCFSSKGSKTSARKQIICRIFTYSINLHIVLIASLLYYLYCMWIPLQLSSNFNFENKPFDQCSCDALLEVDLSCTNSETESSFQNWFIGVPVEPFLIASMVTSFFSHIIHSSLLFMPAPMQLSSYIIGTSEKNESNSSVNTQTKQEHLSMKSYTKKAVLGIAIATLLAGVLSSPGYIFGSTFEKGEACQTVDNVQCTFPFNYDGHTFWSCTDIAKDGVPEGSRWCATDADLSGHFKSVGICKSIAGCIPIFRPSSNTTCNVLGTVDFTSNNLCICKEGYRGIFCQYCDFLYNYYAIDGTDGDIDLVSGTGVSCSCCETVIMMAGGFGGWGLNPMFTTEFIGSEQSCSISNLPYSIALKPTMFQLGREIVLCGGISIDDNKLDKCLRYQNGKWSFYNKLVYPRAYHAGIATSRGLYMFGGGESPYTTEFLERGSTTWIEGPSIPGGFKNGCVVQISDDELLLIGGEFNKSRILIINLLTNEFTESHISLIHGRLDHQCMVFQSNIIITGGYSNRDKYGVNYILITEVIQVNDNGSLDIKEAGSLNAPRSAHGMGIIDVETIPTCITFGGQDSNPMHSIEILDDNLNTWIISNLTLKEERSEFGYATVPTQFFCP